MKRENGRRESGRKREGEVLGGLLHVETAVERGLNAENTEGTEKRGRRGETKD